MLHLEGHAQDDIDQVLPWHTDNLVLEVLIGQGVLGLLLFLAVVASAMGRLAAGRSAAAAIAPFLVASVTGAVTVGLVSSIMDAPRVAFLLLLVALVALHLKAA
jgi:O-antigen ligase